MAIAGAHHNPPAARPAETAPGLVDRWTLTGISPCCACTCGGHVLR